MEKIIKALSSRTVWTIIAIFIINGVPSIEQYLSPDTKLIVDAFLALLATYFRVNTRV